MRGFHLEGLRSATAKSQREKKTFFQRDIQNILQLLDREQNPGMQISLLDFSINAIGRELEAEVTSRFLCHDESEDDSKHPYEIYLAEKHGASETIKNAALSDYNVITQPWKRGSLLHAVDSVFRYGFLQSEGIYNGTLYQELGLVVIGDGRHHLTAARIKGTASADLRVYSLKPCFSTLTTDGSSWFYEEEQDPVGDYRIALLYELARKRYQVCQGLLFPEPTHSPITQNELPFEITEVPQEVAESLQSKNDDLQYLSNENRILARHVNRLLKKLEQAGLPDDILKYTGQ